MLSGRCKDKDAEDNKITTKNCFHTLNLKSFKIYTFFKFAKRQGGNSIINPLAPELFF